MLTLVIIILSLVLILWIFTMYLLWKVNNGLILQEIKQENIEKNIEKVSRFTRKKWYLAIIYSKKLSKIAQGYTKKAFLKVAPGAKGAFVENREILETQSEPSSPFLKEISNSKKETKGRLSKNRKML